MIKGLSLLVPAFDDAKTIERAVREAHEIGEKVARRFEIVVVDDGSNDDTSKILKSLGKKYQEFQIITHSENLGYGKTIKELYYAGRYDWLFTIPGDYQVGAIELLKFLPYIEKADMIIGWRKNRIDPAGRIIQSTIYNRLLQVLFGLRLHDVNSVRLMRREILRLDQTTRSGSGIALFGDVRQWQTRSHLSFSSSLNEGPPPKYSNARGTTMGGPSGAPHNGYPRPLGITLISNSAFVDAELAIKAKRAGFAVIEVPIGNRASLKRGSGGNWWTIIPTIWEMVKFKLNV